jgi:murein DD-endopeptidase MepM/ murein hydrolase activator NlpD
VGGSTPDGVTSGPGTWLVALLWLVTVMMLAILAWAVSQRAGTVFSQAGEKIDEIAGAEQQSAVPADVEIPEYRTDFISLDSLTRQANPYTVIPERGRDTIITYTVEAGDSVFTIAKLHKLKPETILWANEDILQDNPNELSIGQNLKIPPVDGLIYKWKTNDTVEGIANKFKTTPEEILTWPENNLDMANPKIASGTMVMIPNGSRALRSWVVPTFWRANAGANKGIQAGCDTSGGSAFGSGSFVWPAASRLVSGNDYWSGHLGLDIGAAMGAPIYASDSGVVVYAGGIDGGYGLMVMIDHGNGFHTLYAHLSSILVRCGQNVAQGSTIAYSGSSGNSTGAHLHFEIRYMGAFVNPRDYTQ